MYDYRLQEVKRSFLESLLAFLSLELSSPFLSSYSSCFCFCCITLTLCLHLSSYISRLLYPIHLHLLLLSLSLRLTFFLSLFSSLLLFLFPLHSPVHHSLSSLSLFATLWRKKTRVGRHFDCHLTHARDTRRRVALSKDKANK